MAWALAAQAEEYIIARLIAAITDALAYPMMRARSADLAQESFPRPYARGPRRITEAEIGKWWPIIKAR